MTEFEKYAVGHLGMSSNGLHDYNRKAGQLWGLTPNIIEERSMNIVAMDVFSRLMMDRIIFLGTGVDDYVANIIVAQLLFLQSADAKKDISIYVNSPGGSVSAGLAIYDVMNHVAPEVGTICVGMAASMGAVLLAAGQKGKRAALKHSRVMIHQPLGGAQGQITDMEITLALNKKYQEQLYNILAAATGHPYEKIYKDCDRDNWMIAEEAQTYGLVDEVIGAK
jgi:ATP-dependent Clp protease protease subunit